MLYLRKSFFCLSFLCMLSFFCETQVFAAEASLEELQQKAAAGDVEAQSALTQRYIKEPKRPQEDYQALAGWLEKSAKENNPLAQTELANLYSNGMGVKKDIKHAFALFKRAADQGFARAYGGVGLIYYMGGGGIERDYKEAKKWFERAANEGNHGLSMLRLGYVYLDGLDVKKDAVEALKWFKKAAGQDLGEAYDAIGRLYELGAPGIPKNLKEAAVWYQGAVDRNYMPGYVSLGNVYRDGKGVPKNYTRAAELFQQAADSGSSAAHVNLGAMYADGTGVPKDPEKAFQLMLKAAEMGHPYGQHNVAFYYRRGKGVKVDKQKAYEWYQKAAVQGDEEARAKRDELRKELKIGQETAAADAGIKQVTAVPRQVSRGAEVTIAVHYVPAESATAVVEDWTLLFNGESVMTFQKKFDVDKGHARHEFTLPIPEDAAVGSYTLKLRAALPKTSLEGQVLIDIKE